MIEPQAVRRIAMALPEAEDRSSETRLAFEVRGKGFAWSWLERLEPKKGRVPRLDVLAIRCDPVLKEIVIAEHPERFVDDDHYRGYPAVVVRLAMIEEDQLRALITAGWRCQAPKALVRAWDGRG